jgi:hypothetical protein
MAAWRLCPAAIGAGSTSKLGDASYQSARDEFSEGGIADRIAVSGSHVLWWATLSVGRALVPGDRKPPLQALPR